MWVICALDPRVVCALDRHVICALDDATTGCHFWLKPLWFISVTSNQEIVAFVCGTRFLLPRVGGKQLKFELDESKTRMIFLYEGRRLFVPTCLNFPLRGASGHWFVYLDFDVLTSLNFSMYSRFKIIVIPGRRWPWPPGRRWPSPVSLV